MSGPAWASAPLPPAVDPAAPAVLRAALPDARRAGASRLTVWGFDVYDASLWVTPGFRAADWAQSAFALQLRYLRDFEGREIAQRSLDEMRRAAPPMTEAQSRQWLHAMASIFPNVRQGDRLLGLYEPGTGVRFFYNGAPIGTVNDASFAQRFFAIWLGPQTSEPAMRDALLAPLK